MFTKLRSIALAGMLAALAPPTMSPGQELTTKRIVLNSSDISEYSKDLGQQTNSSNYLIDGPIRLDNFSNPTEWYANELEFSPNGVIYIASKNLILHLGSAISIAHPGQIIISAFTPSERKAATGAPGEPGAPGPNRTGDGQPGGNGSPGQPGTAGTDGASAGNVTLILHQLPSSLLALDLNGQSGGTGGDGGKGGRGGDGGQGRPARAGVFACNAGGGNGGRGGNGGNGGVAGAGGAPGRSGTLTVILVQSGISKEQVADRFKLVGSPAVRGAAGQPGPEGDPGGGGGGGHGGGFCTGGRPGASGSPGHPGSVPPESQPVRASPPSLLVVSY